MSERDLSDLREDYRLSSLHESSLAKSPFVQFDRWFEEALSLGGFEANAMTLCTADANGQPSARIVLLKKYSTEGFVFYTNYQSKKGQELLQNPKASILFFWEKMQRQIRIEGTVEKINEEDSIAYFNSRPIASQIGATISTQSQKIANRKVLEDAFEAQKNKADLEKPKHWGGYCLKPHYFEYWQGGAHRLHDRLVFEKTVNDEKWMVSRLAP